MASMFNVAVDLAHLDVRVKVPVVVQVMAGGRAFLYAVVRHAENDDQRSTTLTPS